MENIKIAEALVRQFEGFKLTPYYDSAGYPTVGVGHLLSHERYADLGQWPSITPEQAEAFLEADLAPALLWVPRLIKAKLTDQQWGALGDFIFNLGSGALQRSTLRNMLNRGDYEGAANEFPKWNKAGGIVRSGLTRRRLAERQMFLS